MDFGNEFSRWLYERRFYKYIYIYIYIYIHIYVHISLYTQKATHQHQLEGHRSPAQLLKREAQGHALPVVQLHARCEFIEHDNGRPAFAALQ